MSRLDVFTLKCEFDAKHGKQKSTQPKSYFLLLLVKHVYFTKYLLSGGGKTNCNMNTETKHNNSMSKFTSTLQRDPTARPIDSLASSRIVRQKHKFPNTH